MPALRQVFTAFAAVFAYAAAAQEVHFPPVERLDAIDARLIAKAERSIDFAAYSLTEPLVIQALADAKARGVKVRIVLEPREVRRLADVGDLVADVRIKQGGPQMRLKAYGVADETLRTGSANFSMSGKTQPNKDLLISRDTEAIVSFEDEFEWIYRAAASPAARR